MKKKEWINYFETINDRKPTAEEISQALKNQEFKGGLFDRFLVFMHKKIPNKNLRITIGVIILVLIVGIVFFSEFKKIYNASMSETYNKEYTEVIEKYQQGLDKNSSDKLLQKIISQPSRQPSYAQIDSDGDNKKELYIAFKDRKDKYEIIAIYEAEFGSVKKIDITDMDISDNQLENANWNSFDVAHLLTMNLKELLNQNYDSIKGTWESRDKSQNIVFDSEGLAYINGYSARQKKSTTFYYNDVLKGTSETDLSGRFVFGEVSSGYLSGNLEEKDGSSTLTTFYFIPKGIEFGESDEAYDRIYDSRHKTVYYRSIDIVSDSTKTSLDKVNSKMNIDELEKGDYSTIVGTWVMPNVQGLATKVRIDENGIMYWDNSTTAGKKIHDVLKNSDNSALGIVGEEYNHQSAPTGSYINFFPAGVVVKGGENSDSSKDRIAFGNSTTYYNDPYVFYRLDE